MDTHIRGHTYIFGDLRGPIPAEWANRGHPHPGSESNEGQSPDPIIDGSNHRPIIDTHLPGRSSREWRMARIAGKRIKDTHKRIKDTHKWRGANHRTDESRTPTSRVAHLPGRPSRRRRSRCAPRRDGPNARFSGVARPDETIRFSRSNDRVWPPAPRPLPSWPGHGRWSCADRCAGLHPRDCGSHTLYCRSRTH